MTEVVAVSAPDVVCDPREPLPAAVGGGQQWAVGCLGAVASMEGWQPGRYAYSAAQRDDIGHTLTVFARGNWDWKT